MRTRSTAFLLFFLCLEEFGAAGVRDFSATFPACSTCPAADLQLSVADYATFDSGGVRPAKPGLPAALQRIMTPQTSKQVDG
jgi:hypothetical protein